MEISAQFMHPDALTASPSFQFPSGFPFSVPVSRTLLITSFSARLAVQNRFCTYGDTFVSSSSTSGINARSFTNSMEFMRW